MRQRSQLGPAEANEVPSNSIFHEIAEIIVNTNIWSKHPIESYDSKLMATLFKTQKTGMLSGLDFNQ